MSTPVLRRATVGAILFLACATPATFASDPANGSDAPDSVAASASVADAAPTAPTVPGMESDQIQRTVYACADGKHLEVVTLTTADGNSYAVIEHDGHLVPMRIAISASGARWLAIDPDTALELWEHQGKISLYQGEGGPAILSECPVENP